MTYYNSKNILRNCALLSQNGSCKLLEIFNIFLEIGAIQVPSYNSLLASILDLLAVLSFLDITIISYIG